MFILISPARYGAAFGVTFARSPVMNMIVLCKYDLTGGNRSEHVVRAGECMRVKCYVIMILILKTSVCDSYTYA